MKAAISEGSPGYHSLTLWLVPLPNLLEYMSECNSPAVTLHLPHDKIYTPQRGIKIIIIWPHPHLPI